MSLDDNTPGFIPPLTPGEQAGMAQPPRSLYRTQLDGAMVRPASVPFGRDAQHLVDLETVVAFVERLSVLMPSGEPPAHVDAALRLRAWLEGQA